MLWHTGKEIFDEIIRDQGVPEVKFSYVRLGYVLAGDKGRTNECEEKQADVAEKDKGQGSGARNIDRSNVPCHPQLP